MRCWAHWGRQGGGGANCSEDFLMCILNDLRCVAITAPLLLYCEGCGDALPEQLRKSHMTCPAKQPSGIALVVKTRQRPAFMSNNFHHTSWDWKQRERRKEGRGANKTGDKGDTGMRKWAPYSNANMRGMKQSRKEESANARPHQV